MADAVLFATVGTTDLQLLARCEQSTVRIGIGRGLRDFHEALLAGAVQYVMDASAEALGASEVKERDQSVEFTEGRLVPPNAWNLDWRESEAALVPRKLARAVERIESEGHSIRGCILFCTWVDRNGPGGQRDPVAAGPVLAKWLASRSVRAGLQLCGGGRKAVDAVQFGSCGPVAYLLDNDALHDKQTGHLNPNAVSRIDRAVRVMQDSCKNDVLAFVATSGGPGAALKEVVEACVRFRFGRDRWQPITVTERDEETRMLATDIANLPRPQDVFRAREMASELIRRGDFAGAYGALSHLENDPRERRWLRQVRWAAEYLGGSWRQGPGEDGKPPALFKALPENDLRCLPVALRAEAALAAGNRVPEAVFWTVTFMDAAFRDWLEMMGGAKVLNEMKRIVEFPGGPPASWISEGYVRRVQEERDGPLSSRELADGFKFSDDVKTLELWLRSARVRALERYLSALRKSKHRLTPRGIRNRLMHSHLPPKELALAADVLCNAGLWSSGVGVGHGFLCQPTVEAVLDLLGVGNAADLYKDLVDTLLKLLKDPDAGHE